MKSDDANDSACSVGVGGIVSAIGSCVRTYCSEQDEIH